MACPADAHDTTNPGTGAVCGWTPMEGGTKLGRAVWEMTVD